jgi:hypothetical protein
MDMLRRVVAVFLVGIFMVTAAHFILSPFYPDSLDAGRLWDILNPFMAVAMVAVLVAHWVRKHKLDSGGQDGAMTREYIEANLSFYAAALLTVWFFWNWFDAIMAGGEQQGQTNRIIWAFIDPLFIVLTGITGCYLWRTTSRQ